MANPKILEQKQIVIDEIKDVINNATSVVLFEYRGLTVDEMNNLRRSLRESGSNVKVYKDSLTARALDELKLDLGENVYGPNAMAYGTDAILPIKIVNELIKKNPNAKFKVGIVDGKVTEVDELTKLASIPSRDTLLTQVAAGLLQHVKDFAIALDLHSKNLEEKN